MTDQHLDRLRSCYTSVLHDVMRAMGLRDAILDEMDPQQAYLKYGKF